ncbi:hypothetical protein QSJ19_26125 [Gordonia sp. ABSL11-1]|uniref:hypothetical protein n=1 Tax=Gordonia sp. ABSL11-1 TaxID=3053924 RepID=UPI002572B4FA|nr:hypothetical protein [Gordonia sp. ABSL11-1]MDL9948995.1 hypothetical protein [Gordonia sp. ABSL11-1]
MRKFKGRLVLTRTGKSLAGDPSALADHIARSLIPLTEDRFTTEAIYLLLFFAATTDDGTLPCDRIASLLTYLDWRHDDGSPITDRDLYHLDGDPYHHGGITSVRVFLRVVTVGIPFKVWVSHRSLLLRKPGNICFARCKAHPTTSFCPAPT